MYDACQRSSGVEQRFRNSKQSTFRIFFFAKSFVLGGVWWDGLGRKKQKINT